MFIIILEIAAIDLFSYILMQFQINLFCLTRLIKCHMAHKLHLDC